MKIAVLPHLLMPGWSGHGPFKDCGIARANTLEEFSSARDTDAMAVAYSVPGNDEAFPRLNKEALSTLKDLGQEPLLHWVFLDIDNQDHAPWADKAAAYLALAKATSETGMGGYTTRAGLRLVARVVPPLPVSLANSFLTQFGESLGRDDIDPSSYEWTRLMRLPRATRDGAVLESFILLDNLKCVDPYHDSYTLTEQVHEVGDWGDAPPEPCVLTWEEWQHAGGMPWARRGSPVPPDVSGSSYSTMRTALARIAARGKYTDPHTLASFLWESVLATAGSSVDMGSLWKVACWVADRQAEDVDGEGAPATETLPTGEPTEDEWNTVRKALAGRKSRTYASLKDGLPLNPTKARYEEYTYRTLRELAEETDLQADGLYRVMAASVTKQKAPLLAEVWAKCQELVAEYGSDDAGADDRRRRAFIETYPLTLACPNPGTPLFQLDTTTTPFGYIVTSEQLVELDFEANTAPGLPFEADYTGLPVRSLLAKYGGRVESIAYASGVSGCRYDETQSVMHMGVHQLAKCKPVYHQKVAEWLELLGGSDPQGLKDWLACVTYTRDQPLCALYINGGAGIGKSLLGKGVSSLWNSPPVDYNKVTSGDFNFEFITNPLVFADEGVVVDRHNQSAASQVFRNLVADTVQYVNAKFKQPIPLRGAMRVLVCANDEHGLPFKDSLGADGIEAITQRVMYVKADANTTTYLQGLGGREHVESWAPSDNSPGKIAEHLLWLRDNHQVTPTNGGRFMVVGRKTAWHTEFGARQGIKPGVLQVVYALRAKLKAGVAVDDLRLRDDLEERTVWVHPTDIFTHWDDYARSYKAKPAQIKDAIRQLAGGKHEVKSFGNKAHRVVGIPYSAFIDAGVCEEDDLC
jgi:hypothetical protein